MIRRLLFFVFILQGKYLGSNKHMYAILVTGPLCTSEYAGECCLSENLCKRALDVTVEATSNRDILTINSSEDFAQSNMNDYNTHCEEM